MVFQGHIGLFEKNVSKFKHSFRLSFSAAALQYTQIVKRQKDHKSVKMLKFIKKTFDCAFEINGCFLQVWSLQHCGTVAAEDLLTHII